MFTCKVKWLWLLVIGGIVTACTPTTVNVSGKDERNTTQAQTVPDYPPMYDVDVKVCGNIIAPLKDGKRCVNQQLRLWGPVGEAKLVRAGISLPSVSSVEHKLAIASKGCYPVYSQPDQQQFYWANSIIQVNKGETAPTVEVKPTQLSNQQIDELMTSKLSSRTITTFGGAGCEAASSVK
ncbi:hypothetical protein CDG76_34480 [Nostoc sp. 'Peltigera membranacea cyanobiont' 210A]|uniref:hypothetical protein n=1 Tax=Nostoc sp. 'Peltigera membranacea cyanobiont' 210A TaxID=2014529 RepID=UPI000B953854|nr:hypothetical protein [Nostoc sp. 'Peltigera membranacea cyanobiont' 210A]OYD89690.1 hypothetical protein CDG76_34480 [Nostoc sp. 'Peltigera membranacea cyanobiont' 210A]